MTLFYAGVYSPMRLPSYVLIFVLKLRTVEYYIAILASSGIANYGVRWRET
jgi:hypothetical protein